jgi:hypothetical protein
MRCAASQCERFSLRMKAVTFAVVSWAAVTRCATKTGKFGPRRNETPGTEY